MGKYSLDSYQRVDSLVIRPAYHRAPPPNPGYGLADPFPADLPLIPLEQASHIIRAPGEHPAFALLLTPDESGWLNTAQALAEAGLQRHWESAPVYARLLEVPDAARREQLRSWRVRAANISAGLDADLRLRRATFPRALSSKGALPLRLWLDNAGPSPLYGRHRMLLRFRAGGEAPELPLVAEDHLFQKTGDIVYNEILGLPELPLAAPDHLFQKTGDIVYNEIMGLPELRLGEVNIDFSLRGPEGGPVYLNTGLPENEGWYTLGMVRADNTPRPQLFTLWDDWYPDGYYPLEDPKEPLAE